jgi:hypothetical protein
VRTSANSRAKRDPNSSVEWLATAIGQATRSAKFLVAGRLPVYPGLDVEGLGRQAVRGRPPPLERATVGFLISAGYRQDQLLRADGGDGATCTYDTGIDPFTGQEVFVARHLRDRKLQRALLQYFDPRNYFEVRKALE